MEEQIVVKWSFSALEMLAEIHEYISENNETAADNYVDGIYESTEKLVKHPESCAPCRNKSLAVAGYRCCKYKNHLIIYRFKSPEVHILAVIHSGRNPTNLAAFVKD